MKRIAIVGGGIAGLSAAHQIARHKEIGAPVECFIFEAGHRLGGIVETEHRGGFVLECGPDSWVTEKREARELAAELGLESQIIQSRDELRKTYLAKDGALHALPSGMRMMVPVDLEAMLKSPLFSMDAKAACLRERDSAKALRMSALDAGGGFRDESVRDFVCRHFGAEIADTFATPLLAGVFGGDISELSARAVLPAYVELEREHGSLIAGLQKRASAGHIPNSVFTTLRDGLGVLVDAMTARIPPSNIHYGSCVQAVKKTPTGWKVHTQDSGLLAKNSFDAVLVATPAKMATHLLAPLDNSAAELLPFRVSSAIAVNFGFASETAASIKVPPGFGFLVPQRFLDDANESAFEEDLQKRAERSLLACTFVDQKFDCRAPQGARLLRAFFGGPNVDWLLEQHDREIETLALQCLQKYLGKLPSPVVSLVHRLPASLPLYQVGHLERMRRLESKLATFSNLRLIGNAYHGVGLPDVIGGARKAAREIVSALASAH